MTEAKCLEVLQSIRQDDDRIARVHAAESLIQFGRPAGIAEQYRLEWKQSSDETGYRAVVMRVLHRVDTECVEGVWKHQLLELFANHKNPDRLHAIESLAKLGGPIPEATLPAIRQATSNDLPPIAIFAHWALAEANEEGHEDSLVPFLTNPDPAARYCAAYVLRHRCPLSAANRTALRDAAQSETPGTLAYSYLNSASFVAAHHVDPSEVKRTRSILAQVLRDGSKDDVREACAALGNGGNNADVVLLSPLLENAHPDIRAGAAHAILEIILR